MHKKEGKSHWAHGSLKNPPYALNLKRSDPVLDRVGFGCSERDHSATGLPQVPGWPSEVSEGTARGLRGRGGGGAGGRLRL